MRAQLLRIPVYIYTQTHIIKPCVYATSLTMSATLETYTCVYIYVCMYVGPKYVSMYVCVCIHTYICVYSKNIKVHITYIYFNNE